MKPFIDAEEIWDYLNQAPASAEKVRAIIQKSLDKNRLNLEEVAALVNTTDPALVAEILEGARELKKRVYGNRIVLFAPLYIGNKCTNNCRYCGFRTSNKEAERVTLNDAQIVEAVEALRRPVKSASFSFTESIHFTPRSILPRTLSWYTALKKITVKFVV